MLSGSSANFWIACNLGPGLRSLTFSPGSSKPWFLARVSNISSLGRSAKRALSKASALKANAGLIASNSSLPEP